MKTGYLKCKINFYHRQLLFSTSSTADPLLQEDQQDRLCGALRQNMCSGKCGKREVRKEENVTHQGQWVDSVSSEKAEMQTEAVVSSEEPSFKAMGLSTKARPRLCDSHTPRARQHHSTCSMAHCAGGIATAPSAASLHCDCNTGMLPFDAGSNPC